MKPYAKFIFEKIPEASTRFILRKHSGADISDFLAVWKLRTHRYYGEKYIGFMFTKRPLSIHGFVPCLCLEGNRIIAYLRFLRQFPNKLWGDYGNDAILLDFDKEKTVLTILFFKDMKKHSHSLFRKWVDGELDVTIEIQNPPIQQEFDWND